MAGKGNDVAEGAPYVTTPPVPPTGPPGPDATFEAVGADVYARSCALRGREARLAVGSLDYGRGVLDAAFDRGGTAEGWTEQWAEDWQAVLEALDVRAAVFTRTSETPHQRVVKALFLKLFDQGDIAKDKTGGYVLRASRHAKATLAHLDEHPDFILPAARQEAALRAASEDGVSDVTLSRERSEWAIAVPIDPDHAIDDWFDALVSYLTGSGYLADPQLFERVWPPVVQVVTAQALRTHALAWPALLFAAGLQLPEHLLVRGRLQLDGATDAGELVEQMGSDALRYGLLRSARFTDDASLSVGALAERCNADLSDRLGRLVDEVLTAVEQRREGRVPRPGSLADAESALVEAAGELFAETSRRVGDFDFGGALDRVWALVDSALGYAHGVGLTRAEGRRLDTALYVLAETCRLVALSLRPFLPRAARAIEGRLGLEDDGHGAADLSQWGRSRPQARIRRGEPLLPRIALPTS
ncbi:MAG: class I tRNA ligase family protein [bacterium]